jgi:ribosomal protein S18 acetylase RimI-like enzyme
MSASGIEQWDEVYPTDAILESDIQDGSMYVAVVEGELAGLIVLNEQQDPTYAGVLWAYVSERVIVVHRLMIDPRFQQRGIARTLMAFAEGRARELGYAVVRLDAFVHNPRAVRLYQTLGYRDAGAVMLRKGPFRCFEKRLDSD